MTAEDLARLGYTRALWIPSTERWYLGPDGLAVVSEAAALREIAELLGEEEPG